MNAVTIDLIYFIWLLIYRFTVKYVCFIPYSPYGFEVRTMHSEIKIVTHQHSTICS